MVRLFQNLIGNAVKYRQADRSPKIHISAEPQATEWIISIHDNGIGFDPKHAATIFAPFKRLHTAEEYPGTGVGLAICKRIVQAQGGRIWAESLPGEGTTFFFTLPVDTAQPLKHTPPIIGLAPWSLITIVIASSGRTWSSLPTSRSRNR